MTSTAAMQARRVQVTPMPSGRLAALRYRQQRGVTFIGLLVLIALFGLGAVGGARILASTERAQKENELIYIGNQYRNAIQRYYQAGPNAGTFPPTLEDLLLDKRSPVVLRHLRRIYIDPITGKAKWGFVRAPNGGIMGVYSLSEREPMKRTKFEPADASIELVVKNKLTALNMPLRAWQTANAPAGQASAPVSLPLPPTSTKLTSLASMSTGIDGEAAETKDYSYKDWKFIFETQSIGTTQYQGNSPNPSR
jgi:type II secretory pathway pseudopilin PulG